MNTFNFYYCKDFYIVIFSIAISTFFFIFFKKYITISQERGALNKKNISNVIGLHVLRTSIIEKIFIFILVLILGIFKLTTRMENLILVFISIYLLFFLIRATYRLYKL